MAYPRSHAESKKSSAKPAARPKAKAAAVSSKIKSAATKTKTAVTAKLATEKTTATTARAKQVASVSYAAFYRESPIERIAMIRRGIHASVAKQIIADLALGQGTALKALNLSTATVNRRAKQEHTLSPAESERVIGIARLVGQVEVMVRDSGDPVGFDAKAWISRWLREPLPSLGGECPVNLMDTIEGQTMVSTALAQIEGGAYA